MRDEEIIADALQKYPDCKFVRVISSIEEDLSLARVALMWPDESMANGPPKYRLNGYPPYDEAGKRVNLPLRDGFELP